MASDTMTINVRVERIGLIFSVFFADSGSLIGQIDIKKEYALSDERAAQVLAQLDEQDKQKAGVTNDDPCC